MFFPNEHLKAKGNIGYPLKGKPYKCFQAIKCFP